MKSVLLTDLIHFPKFLFLDVPAWWLRFIWRLIIYVDNQLAVSLMLQLWFTPVWQDTSILGRVLSFIFRTFRIIYGTVILLLTTTVTLVSLLLWVGLLVFIPFDLPVSLPILVVLWGLDAVSLIYSRNRKPIYLLLRNSNRDINLLYENLIKDKTAQKLLESIEENTFPKPSAGITYQNILTTAHQVMIQAGDKELRVEHLLLSFIHFTKFHETDAETAYLWQKNKKKWVHVPWIFEDSYPIRPIGGINRGWTGIATPELNKVSADLTQKAADGKIPEIVGKQQQIEEIVRVLGHEGRENVLVVGEAGSGKTTLIDGLANEIIRGTPYPSLKFKRLVMLDIAALTAGSLEEVKKRLVTIIAELKIAGNVILFIDEIESIVTTEIGPQATMIFAALEPHLDAGEFQFIASTTPVAFKKYIESNEAFIRTFHVIQIARATPEEAESILQWKAFLLEQKHNVKISYRALQSSVELAYRYIHDRVLPDSAVDLLEETVDSISADKKYITVSDIENEVTQKTHVPIRSADSKKEKDLLLHLENELHRRIVGQNEAIKSLASALRRVRTGMSEEGKLLASFLFAGATGVGKTETAKALAGTYFGSEKSMVRLDMSEYQTADSLNRLVGPPPGQIGYESGGQLTEAIRRRPFSLILLDEIEKATPRVLDVFLQVLDDARLTDGLGKTVDFSNTMVIATSNVGATSLLEAEKAGKTEKEIRVLVLNQVHDGFRPEFLNRFTGIVVFQPLRKEEMRQITSLLLNNLKDMMTKKDITLEFSQELVDHLLEKGFSPYWGARELKRVILQEVEEKIAQKILEGKMRAGETYSVTPKFLTE